MTLPTPRPAADHDAGTGPAGGATHRAQDDHAITGKCLPPASTATATATAAVAAATRQRRRGSGPAARAIRGAGVVPGLFDGAHSFTLEPISGGRTRLVQSETFRGVVVWFSRGLLNNTAAGFAAMNDALRDRVRQTTLRDRNAHVSESA